MFKADYHLHTKYCDGKDSPEDMALAALDMGLKQMGFSGHMDPPAGVSMDIESYMAEIIRVREKYRDSIDIFLGGEMDCLFDAESVSGLEYIIGSTHTLKMDDGEMFSVDDSEEVLKNNCERYFGGDYYALSKAYYETEARIIDRVHPDIIGHFDLVLRFNDSMHFIDEDDPKYYKTALDTLEYLSKADVHFEINCGAVNRGRKKEFYPNTRLLKALREFGGRIVLSGDAHDKDHICGGFEEAAIKARECGFKSAFVLKRGKDGRPIWVETSLD